MRLGAHLSIARGLPEAAALAQSIGADTFAFFTRNPRGGAARTIPPEEIAAWEEARAAAGVWDLVGHLPYTVNLAAAKPQTWAFAKMAVEEDLRKAEAIGCEYLAVHPGAYSADEGLEAGLSRIISALDEIFSNVELRRTTLLLETMAGQGHEVGGELWHFGRIFEALGRPLRLGLCLDSCHLFAAGHDLREPAGVRGMLEELDRQVGLDRVKALHLNDSKGDLGSRRDRHELIGRGFLGDAGIRAVVTDPFIAGLPMIIETPVKDYGEYAGEIRRVKEIAVGESDEMA